MSLLTVKLVVTPLMVLVAWLAARRWGEAVGGWLVGLPLTSGPVAVFLALEQDPTFAAEAAAGSTAGVVAQAAFVAGYAAALASRGPVGALAAGTQGATLRFVRPHKRDAAAGPRRPKRAGEPESYCSSSGPSS